MVTTSFAGRVFRCIPHSSTEPLSTVSSLQYGGRWNSPESFPVLYTFLNRNLARTWVEARFNRDGVALTDAQPEILPDLLVLECDIEPLADLTSDAGLEAVGLPDTYPKGFETEAAYGITRRIGTQIFNERAQGILTRSATAPTWSGPTVN